MMGWLRERVGAGDSLRTLSALEGLGFVATQSLAHLGYIFRHPDSPEWEFYITLGVGKEALSRARILRHRLRSAGDRLYQDYRKHSWRWVTFPRFQEGEIGEGSERRPAAAVQCIRGEGAPYEAWEELITLAMRLGLKFLGENYFYEGVEGNLVWRPRPIYGEGPIHDLQGDLEGRIEEEWVNRLLSKRYERVMQYRQERGEQHAKLDPMPAAAEYLLPEEHPYQEKLHQLFRDRCDWIDPRSASRVGFRLVRSRDERPGDFWVMEHPEVPEWVFKLYAPLDIWCDPYETAAANLIRRARHARRARYYCESHHLEGVVIPQKWLWRLPTPFYDSFTPHGQLLLLAEHLDLQPREEVPSRRERMGEKRWADWMRFRQWLVAYDDNYDNAPITQEGRIAALDLESCRFRSEKRSSES